MALQQGVADTRQDVPGESQKSGGPPPGAPQGPPPSGASDKFSSDTLSSVLSAQEYSGSNDLASKLIGQADSDGDGLLSLSEIQSTLGDDPSGSSNSTGLTAALGALDTDGDGKLSQSELSAALDKAKSAHHGHHGHHAHAAEPTADSTTTAADDTESSQATTAA